MSVKKKTFSKNKIFWGLVLIGAAVFLILGGLGVDLGFGISWWRIVLGVLCLAWLIDRLVEQRFAQIVFPLAFIFLIFEPTIAHAAGREDCDLISNWIVLLAALLLTVGLSVVLPKKYGSTKLVEIGSKTVMLDGGDLSDASICDNVGRTDVYITDPDAYDGRGVIRILDNVGRIRLFLPKSWNVVLSVKDNIGSVDVPDQTDGVFDKSITVEVTDNVGAVKIILE